MKKYLYDYVKLVDQQIESNNVNYEELLVSHLQKIQFFQHERLIHLLVTLFYSLFMIIFLILSLINILFLSVFLILVIFVLFYVVHYFRLENGVQHMYKQYDRIKSKVI